MTPFVFFGTPEFALPVLDSLEGAGRLPVALVCQPDRPKGRGLKLEAPPVKAWAEKRALPVLQPERLKDPAFLERFHSLEPKIALVVAFGQLLPPELLELPPGGFINVHPSLLPRYRGAAPMQWTLINGDAETGVTILKVTPRLDDGDIILQQAVPVGPDESAGSLHDRLAALGGELTVQALSLFDTGQVPARRQDEGQVVWARALEKDDGRVDWKNSARSIHNRIRGVQPWPGAFTTLNRKILKIHLAAVEPEAATAGAVPGTVTRASGSELLVACGEGQLRLLQVQSEGKKRLPVHEFLLGRPLQAGEVLGG